MCACVRVCVFVCVYVCACPASRCARSRAPCAAVVSLPQRAYYSGDRIIAEVDIVLPEAMSVKESHDIAESLQTTMERLPFVERVSVHPYPPNSLPFVSRAHSHTSNVSHNRHFSDL